MSEMKFIITKQNLQSFFFPKGIITDFKEENGSFYFDVILKNQVYTNFSDGIEVCRIDFKESKISFFIDQNTNLLKVQ